METEDVTSGKVRTIPLTQGKVAIVEVEDYAELSRYKWHAHWSGWKYYAARAEYDPAAGRTLTVYMHRQILGAKPGEQVDHRNRNGLDNRRENLRIATPAQNPRKTTEM